MVTCLHDFTVKLSRIVAPSTRKSLFVCTAIPRCVNETTTRTNWLKFWNQGYDNKGAACFLWSAFVGGDVFYPWFICIYLKMELSKITTWSTRISEELSMAKHHQRCSNPHLAGFDHFPMPWPSSTVCGPKSSNSKGIGTQCSCRWPRPKEIPLHPARIARWSNTLITLSPPEVTPPVRAPRRLARRGERPELSGIEPDLGTKGFDESPCKETSQRSILIDVGLLSIVLYTQPKLHQLKDRITPQVNFFQQAETNSSSGTGKEG